MSSNGLAVSQPMAFSSSITNLRFRRRTSSSARLIRLPQHRGTVDFITRGMDVILAGLNERWINSWMFAVKLITSMFSFPARADTVDTEAFHTTQAPRVDTGRVAFHGHFGAVAGTTQILFLMVMRRPISWYFLLEQFLQEHFGGTRKNDHRRLLRISTFNNHGAEVVAFL
ncbi:hypothetical protein FQR65_LT20717 [Abscondita terminalis]|nr:hypothetical protein FQR65_LT20717 [Abscondita terminalis]